MEDRLISSLKFHKTYPKRCQIDTYYQYGEVLIL